MASFNNMNDLLKAINSQVKEVTNNEVKKEVKNTMKEHINDIYEEYTPHGKHPYKRRYDSDGGFLSDENINVDVSSLEGDINIKATDDAVGVDDAKDESLTPIIETGIGYLWNEEHQPPARPFLKETAEDLKENGTVVKALKDGLHNKGIKTD